MTYAEVLRNLGAATDREITRLWAQLQDGEITEKTFIDLAATVIAVAQQQGRVAAELSLLAWLRQHDPAALPVAAPPLDHYRSPERLTRAIKKILTTSETGERAEHRITRMAYAETVGASQKSFATALKKSEIVDGWMRGVAPDACQLCRWWWREGRIWPKTHAMPTHTGCTCTQIPVTKENL